VRRRYQRRGLTSRLYCLGRRIEFIDDRLDKTTRYYYDGVNQIAEFDESDEAQRYYVHGTSYVDERLMMTCPLRHEAVSRMDFAGDGPDVGQLDNDRPYYYTLDRMYNP